MVNNQAIHWSEVKASGNPYRLHPTPEMLLPDGCIIVREIKPEGFVVKIKIRIHYDRDYVVAWLRANLIKPMKGIPFNQASKLLGEAYRAEKVEKSEPKISYLQHVAHAIVEEEIEIAGIPFPVQPVTNAEEE